MDTTVKTNLIIKQGAYWSRAWPIINSETDEPMDLTGATARAHVRATRTSGTILADLNPTVDVDAAQVVITVPSTTSLAWQWAEGVFDLYVIDQDGIAYTVTEGAVSVRPAVSRPA